MEEDIIRLRSEQASSAAAAAPPSVAPTASEKSFKSVSDETAAARDEADALQGEPKKQLNNRKH